MSKSRKLIVLPVTQGEVSFATDAWVTVDGLDIERSQIVGRQPLKNEYVMVLDVQDLVDALRDGDDELTEVEVNGSVTRKTNKAVYVDVNGREISIPKMYLDADIDEYVREVRLPRWLAVDRGL